MKGLNETRGGRRQKYFWSHIGLFSLKNITMLSLSFAELKTKTEQNQTLSDILGDSSFFGLASRSEGEGGDGEKINRRKSSFRFFSLPAYLPLLLL